MFEAAREKFGDKQRIEMICKACKGERFFKIKDKLYECQNCGTELNLSLTPQK